MRKLVATLVLLMMGLMLFAQEAKTDITVAEETQWYMQPWAWVAGGVVLLMLFIGLFRRRK